MLANGSSLATVDSLPIEDAKALYASLRAGLWGPYGTTLHAYNTYLSLHMNKEVAVAVASGKKYNPTKPLEFHELFPVIDEHMTLGDGERQRSAKKYDNMATRALLSMPITGAPAWLRDAAKEAQGTNKG
tara:strand:+ start:1225 stop:1614 length:390 start_codon:yes stop_codon:yes gene_type:complete